MFVQETQLAQDTSLQESWPQACNIPGCPAARLAGRLKDHQDPALAAQGQPQSGGAVAPQSGWRSRRSPTDKRGGEAATAKQVEQLPRPAPHRGRAVLQERSPGHCGAEPRSPQPWAPHSSPGLLSAQRQHDREAAVASDAGLCHAPRIRHGSQQDEPGRGGTDEPAVSLAERAAQRGKGPELHPTAQWNSLLQDDRLN